MRSFHTLSSGRASIATLSKGWRVASRPNDVEIRPRVGALRD